MKKRTDSDKVYQKIAAKREYDKKPKKRQSESHAYALGREVIISPQCWNIFGDEGFLEFHHFLDDIKKHAAHGSRMLIDIKEVSQLKACALLMAYSMIEYAQWVSNDKNIVKTTKCRSSKVCTAFQAFGFWSLTGESEYKPYHEIGNHLAITTASAPRERESAEKEPSENRESLRKVIRYTRQEVIPNNDLERGNRLYAAITESISNVGLHAYIGEGYEDFASRYGRKWWIITQRVDDQFFIAVYDCGAGIPETIVRKDFWPKLKELFLPGNDAEKIKAAVKLGGTRLDQNKHGKGLHEMRQLVEDNSKGALHIFSGEGYYKSEPSKNEEVIKELPRGIEGTLVQWNLEMVKENE